MKGTEARTAPCCSALSPPTSSSADAIAPIRQPITAVTVLAGSSTPREASIPITIAAASAPLMKKNAIRIIDSTDVIVVNGSSSSAVKSDSSGVEVVAIRSAAPLICMSIEADPMIANQTKPMPVGIATTPMMNSRIVRPFEMRATNVPTKGAHEIHHAQ